MIERSLDRFELYPNRLSRSVYEGARDMARKIARSWEGRTSRRLRKKIEMLFAHLKRILNLDRRGLVASAVGRRMLAGLPHRRVRRLPARGGPNPGHRLYLARTDSQFRSQEWEFLVRRRAAEVRGLRALTGDRNWVRKCAHLAGTRRFSLSLAEIRLDGGGRSHSRTSLYSQFPCKQGKEQVSCRETAAEGHNGGLNPL